LAGGKPNTVTLKKLLYNLAFIHRAYITTYNTPRGARVPELFIPVKTAQAPCYYKGNDSNLYLKFEVDHSLFGVAPVSIPVVYVNSISSKFKISDDNNFVLQSVNGAKRNQDSLSSEFKNENDELRREFQYIRSSKKLWYLKRTALNHPEVMNLNSMLIIMAAMHRVSEIVRYKPEQMAHLLNSKENWLLHEFLTLALDQFIDELAAEITGQDIMCTGVK
jgi:hypothetical protein